MSQPTAAERERAEMLQSLRTHLDEAAERLTEAVRILSCAYTTVAKLEMAARVGQRGETQ